MDSPGNPPVGPFSTYSAFLAACENYFHPEASCSSPTPDDYGSDEVKELGRRGESLKSGWTFRSIDIDPRFRGPSTPTGYYHRRTKLIKKLVRKLSLQSGTQGREENERAGARESESAEEEEMMDEGDDEATLNLHEQKGHDGDRTLPEEEEGADKGGCYPPAFNANDNAESCAKGSRTKHLDDDKEANCKGEIWIPVFVDWYITYHPTYRIPQLSFDVSEQDGKTISLSDVIGMGIVVVPHMSSASPTIPLSARKPTDSPVNANITDSTAYETDHIPLSPDSPFPLLIRDSNPVLGSSLGFVWTVHPCAVGTHIGELVGDIESSEHDGKQGEQTDRDQWMERWMDVWLGLHSRILPDLVR